jgi:tetratricopeptide (TPR) repeat protein
VPFHGFDFFDYHLHWWLAHALRLSSEAAVIQLFAVLSVAAGGLYLIFAAWSARHLASDAGERVLLYALLVAFAPAQMFMGYVECYAFLAAFLLAFLGALVGHYTRGTRVGWAAVAFGAALAFQLDALFLAPLPLLLLVRPPEGGRGRTWRRILTVTLLPLGVCAVPVAVYLLHHYDAATFRIDFREGRRGQTLFASLTGAGSLLSGARLKDVVNLLLLLAPVPLALLLTAPRGRRPRVENVLLVGAGGLLFLILTVQVALGMARDWDLFAAPAAVFVFLGLLAWRRATGGRPGARLVGTTAAAALCLTLPWFWLNAGEARSVRRFTDVIADLPRFPRAYAHEEIGKYHRKAGRIEEALREYRTCAEIFPGNPRFHVALGGLLYNQGRRDESLPVFQRAFAVDSTFALALEMLVRVHAERGEMPAALGYARRLAGRPEESAQAAGLHGAIATNLGDYPEAIEAYRRALRRDPARFEYVGQIGALALLSGRYELAEASFRAALRREPGSAMAQEGLLEAIWLPLREAPARWGEPEVRRRLEEALRLARARVASGDAGAARGFEDEIRRALGELTRPAGPG